MKQIFIFVGWARTGKTVLSNLLNKQNVIVFDELPVLKDKEKYEGIKRRFDIESLEKQGYEYIVYITNLYENVDYITKKFISKIPVSVCEFKQGFIKVE